MSLANCRIVLVRTRIAANLGATARIMRNMGLNQLVLVNPEADPADERARLLATHSEEILDQALVVPDLAAALADCVFCIGTSAREGGPVRRQSVGSPEEILPRLVETLHAPVALVFGPEPSGLTDEEVTLCHYLMHIPTDPVHPALNLAQAVAICLYELRKSWLKKTLGASPQVNPARFVEMEAAFAHLQEALEAIHFLHGPKAASLMHALRHWLGRAQPMKMEIKVLHGLARQLLWFAKHGGRKPEES